MDDTRAVMLDDEHLRKLQLELLDILVEFDRICRKADIRYFLSSGTLLGAVRHRGFIPWDDDVDVEMLREDYEKFCQVCEQEINHEKYFFQSWEKDPGYRWLYGKMRRKNTEYIRIWQGHMRQQTGLCIDIFPLDAEVEGKWRQMCFYKICIACRKILWAPIGARQCGSVWERGIFRLLALIPKTWPLAVYKRLIAWGKKHGTGENFVSYNADNLLGKKYRRCWYEKRVELEFEGHKFFAVQEYEEELRLLYGDYMKIPSLENRIGHVCAAIIRFSDGEELRSDMNRAPGL